MSRESTSFTDTAIHGKLEPPRSLHGVDDAEVIWNTITRRFPNAAPLLREMEAVIERAEDLLQQLKTPCTQENDTSSSFHTPDSQESNATISMVSDIESFAEETNILEHPEITEIVDTQLTIYDTHEKQADLKFQHRNEQFVECEKKFPDQGYDLNSSPGLDEVVQHFKTSSTHKCYTSQGESSTNITDSGDKRIDVSSEERLMERIAEKNSLDEWEKMTNNALREWNDDLQNITMPDDNDSDTRINVDRNIDNCLLMINNQGRCDKTDVYKLNKTDDIKNNLQDRITKNSMTVGNHRSPLTILEEYAKRCKISIKYEYKPKPNLYVINGDLCGFRAMSCATTQDLAKNELAAKILWMVAERQMNGSKLSSICELLDFSREEILEIAAFNQGELKNASQKLYKFCLEKGVPTPEYSIRNLRTNQGFMYTAQCVALGHIAVGQGLRKDSAKIAAAEKVFQEYIHQMEQQTI